MNYLIKQIKEISQGDLHTLPLRGLLYLLIGSKIQQEKGYFTLKDITEATGDKRQRVVYILRKYPKYIENLDKGKYKIGAYLMNKLSSFFKVI